MVSPIISVAGLAELSESIIIDCRHALDDPEEGINAYLQSHIPGAAFLHLDNDLSGPATGDNGRHPLPDPALFIRKLEALGLEQDATIVVYDSNNGSMAARAWWMLSEWLGFRDIRLLDGGISAWQANNLPVTHIKPARVKTKLRHLTPRPVTADAAAILAHIQHHHGLVILDARSEERFLGYGELRAPVGGHIPGAINRWYGHNLNAAGLFKPADELAREWQALLPDIRTENIIMSCGSGVTACHNLLALKFAGFSGARLYPGSWSEWSCHPAWPKDLPAETGNG